MQYPICLPLWVPGGLGAGFRFLACDTSGRTGHWTWTGTLQRDDRARKRLNRLNTASKGPSLNRLGLLWPELVHFPRLPKRSMGKKCNT